MNIDERRNKPRFTVSLKGNITSADGHVSSIQVSNISSSGLQLVIAQSELPGLIPNNSEVNSLTPVQIELSFDLPDAQAPIKIRCGIVYVKKMSDEQCKVGCRYEHFYQQSNQPLEDHINLCTTPIAPLELTDE